MNLLALTPCVVDFYPQLNKSFLGGNSLNVASMWKTLEPSANVSLITCLGNDVNGKIILDFLKKKEINLSHVYINEGTTANNQLRVDNDGERFGIEGTWRGGLYETFLLSESDWDWVRQQNLVAIPGNNPNFSEMLKRKHNQQMLAVDYLDVENKVPVSDSISFTDIAFVAARHNLLPFYKNLADTTKKLIVVTLGALGSYAYFNGETWFQPAIKVDKVVDTTGCGDAYQAAFALNYYKTHNIQLSMLAGATAASEILKYFGGVGFNE